MFRHVHSALLLTVARALLLGLTGMLAVGQATPVSARTLSIAEARHQPLGSVVRVAGTVSTPSGAFASSFFDEGFGLQDNTAGIYVSVQINLGLGPGQVITVTGTLQNSAGLLILVPARPADVRVTGSAPRVQPEPVATGAVGAANQGLIVRVRGRITQSAAIDRDPTTGYVFGFTFAVNDGTGEIRIFVNVQTGISMSGLTAGRRVSVAGFSSAFDTPEIDPRSPADIVVRDDD